MHTPGPWEMEFWGKKEAIAKIETPDRYIGSLMTDGQERRDNARLIAAAPELLEACIAVKDFFNSHPENAYQTDGMWSMLYSAIKKAEGG